MSWIHSSRSLDKPERLLSIYALLNRIRLCASDAVLAQAQWARDSSSWSNISRRMFRSKNCTSACTTKAIDPLKAFSEACRRELMSMHAPG